MASNIESFLRRQVEGAKSDDAAIKWRRLEELHQKKLWHQLTQELMNCLQDDSFLEGLEPGRVYGDFVSEFEHRINPVSLVRIVAPIVARMGDPMDGVKFLENVAKTVMGTPEAEILCATLVAETLLRHTDPNGKCLDMPRVRDVLEEAEKKLDALPGVTPAHGDYYRVSATYLRESGDFSGYYKEALKYLGCVDCATAMDAGQRRHHALCLALAALLGEDVYNFGELLAHDILKSLGSGSGSGPAPSGPPSAAGDYQWLVDVLYAFNAGDLARFEALRPQWTSQADLAKNEERLRLKIQLLCVMEMAYMRPANKRQISFAEIAKQTRTPEDRVELLVMKALSLGLVKGKINQVAGSVSFSWVQPRVLGPAQVGAMAGRVGDWCRDVEVMRRMAEGEADEILSH